MCVRVNVCVYCVSQEIHGRPAIILQAGFSLSLFTSSRIISLFPIFSILPLPVFVGFVDINFLFFRYFLLLFVVPKMLDFYLVFPTNFTILILRLNSFLRLNRYTYIYMYTFVHTYVLYCMYVIMYVCTYGWIFLLMNLEFGIQPMGVPRNRREIIFF